VELILVPTVGTSREQIEALRHDLSARGFKVEIAAGIPFPAAAYDRRRDQYRAEILLRVARRADADRTLVVTSEDLYAGDLNFVFGIAHAPGPGAVISLHRLRYGADAALLRARALKEAVHELGHSFGLSHCPDPRCVMAFSNRLADTDRKGAEHCRRCKAKLAAAARSEACTDGPRY
jgi:archaemetzincin